MSDKIPKQSVEFFDTQFQRQIREREYALNPFETLALDYLKGTVLDLGSGLGNLSLEAGRRGHHVVAVEASPAAAARINADAQREKLPVKAIQADVESWIIDPSTRAPALAGASCSGFRPTGVLEDATGLPVGLHRPYDTIVAIGLLMFFRRERALDLLQAIQEHINPGGRAIVNVLIEGTTYLGMFDPDNYYLFAADELESRFAGWTILASRQETFPAPGGTWKKFSTVIAEKSGKSL